MCTAESVCVCARGIQLPDQGSDPGACLSLCVDALESSGIWGHQIRPGENRWLGGRVSRMTIVSRHKRGHFHFLMCHLQLPE